MCKLQILQVLLRHHSPLRLLQLLFLLFASPTENIILILGTDIVKPGKSRQIASVFRNGKRRIHHTRRSGHPNLVHLLVLHKQVQFWRFRIIHTNTATIVLLHKIDHIHITFRIVVFYHTILEIAEHLLRCHLIIGNRIHLFYRHRLIDDVNPFHRAVIIIHADFLAKHLLTLVPQSRPC